MKLVVEQWGITSSEYPSFNGLPKTVQNTIKWKALYLSYLDFCEKDLFWEPQIPSGIEKRQLYLAKVSHEISSLKVKYPAQAYKFLGKLFGVINNSVWLGHTIEYLEFLGEFLAAANWNADIATGEQISNNALVLLAEHLQYIASHPLTNRILYKYRWPLVTTVTNIAYYYSRRGDLAHAREYAALWQELSKKFSTAHRKFDLLILEIQLLLRENPRNHAEINRLFIEAEGTGLPSLHTVYKASDESMKLYESAEREYTLLRFQYESEEADLTNGPILASRLTKWRVLKDSFDAKKTEYDASDRQILFQIEIIMYIAIQRYLRNVNKNQEHITIEMPDIGPNSPIWDEQRDTVYETILENHYRIDTTWLDVDKTMSQDNGWLFLWSIVDLFTYRVESLPTGEGYARAISVSHTLHMMLDIYQTALWKNEGSATELTRIFKTRTFYPRYIASCHELMASIGAYTTEANDDEILKWLYGLIRHRDTLEKAHITHVTQEITKIQKIDILKIEKIHPQSSSEEDYYVEEGYIIRSNSESNGKEVNKRFEYNWWTYIISLVSESWGNITEEIIENCIAIIRPLMPSIIRGWHRIADFEAEAGSPSPTTNSAIFRTVITKMWHVGIPREWWDFFKSVLDPDSIAQRTSITQVTKDDLIWAKWVPIIITMSEDEPAISVVNMGEIDNCTYLAIRFWIIDANISYNLPPYDGICIVRILPDGTWSRQWIKCNPRSVSWRDNTRNQSLYEQQIERIGTVIGSKSDQKLELSCIHSGNVWKVYELWEVITEQRFTFGVDEKQVVTSKVTKRNFLIQIKAPGEVDVQLIISSYKDNETGKFVMYIGSMVTSWGVDIMFISKWFSSMLIDESNQSKLTGEKRFTELSENTVAEWERHEWKQDMGKAPKAIPLILWHAINSRRCKDNTIVLDWMPMNCTPWWDLYSLLGYKLFWFLQMVHKPNGTVKDINFGSALNSTNWTSIPPVSVRPQPKIMEIK